MRLKIVSDGSPLGTVVRNADTGEALDGILEVTWRAWAPQEPGDPWQFAECTIRLENVPVDVIGGAF